MSQTVPATSSHRRPQVLLICGSLNQTTQMHQIAQELPEADHAYTPYYGHGYIEALRRAMDKVFRERLG